MSGQQTAVRSSAADAAVRRAGLPALVVACTAAVAGLIDGVRERGDLSTFDPTVTASFVASRSATLTQLAHIVTTLGSAPVLVLLAIVVSSLISWSRRSINPLVTMGVALGGSAVLTYALKAFVARQRPPLVDMLGGPDRDFAFPSGHTLNSAVFLAVLCWLLRHRLAQLRRPARAVVLLLAALAALAVGVSRIYLGYHWMTDVLAGWIVAVGWLSLLLALRQWVRSRREA